MSKVIVRELASRFVTDLFADREAFLPGNISTIVFISSPDLDSSREFKGIIYKNNTILKNLSNLFGDIPSSLFVYIPFSLFVYIPYSLFVYIPSSLGVHIPSSLFVYFPSSLFVYIPSSLFVYLLPIIIYSPQCCTMDLRNILAIINSLQYTTI